MREPNQPRVGAGLPVNLQGRADAKWQWFSQLCLCFEASIRAQNEGFRELLDSWTRRVLKGAVHIPFP